MKRNVMMTAVALSLLEAMPARADWTRDDTVREGLFVGLLAADWAMTERNLSAGGSELNPATRALLGNDPNSGRIGLVLVGIGGAAHLAVSYILPAKWRRTWQAVSLVVETGNVAWMAARSRGDPTGPRAVPRTAGIRFVF